MRSATPLTLALAIACLACGPKEYEGEGVITEVVSEYDQVIIEHGDIPGLMPAMTMNFDVAPGLLEDMEKGQRIHFTVAFDGKSYRVTGFHVEQEGVETGDGPSVAKAPKGRELAPLFELVDQDGEIVALHQYRGKVLLIDFVFTNCPGPCPILTSTHVRVQRNLPDEIRDRVQLVSISLDPERDTPEKMREYALARGVDFSNWSFLTGPASAIDPVLRNYGVGTDRKKDGTIDHLVITFLVDETGRIAERYVGLDHHADDILEDVVRLAS